MTRLHDAIAAVRGALDRDTLAWGVVPAATAALVTIAFVVPNYMRAGALRSESQLLDAVASENISQRNNLARMEESVASMREDAARRCRPLSADGERDGLLDAVTRHSDGLAVREQSIRTGPRETLPAPIVGAPAPTVGRGDQQLARHSYRQPLSSWGTGHRLAGLGGDGAR